MNEDELLDAYRSLEKNPIYLGLAAMKNNYSYKIFAHNAFVGVWVKREKGFLLSRYKIGPNPYLFLEYHCDTMDRLELQSLLS